nr:glycosyltransferase [Bradyrhizobium vignae]
MIEAIACGAPVIAPSHGSAPEIIDHGLSGFVVQPSRRRSRRRTQSVHWIERRFASSPKNASRWSER